MADKKITELNEATIPLTGNEVLPIVQNGDTVKAYVNDINSLVNADNIPAGTTNTIPTIVEVSLIHSNLSEIEQNTDAITLLETGKADKINVLELDNTDSYTPTLDYHPATKKYVDDNSGGTGSASDITLDTGSVIDLSNPLGNYCNQLSASNVMSFTTENEVFGGWAKVLINTTNPPEVVGATQDDGNEFTYGIDMYLVVYYDNSGVKYFYLKKEPTFINEIVPKQSEYVNLIGSLDLSVAGYATITNYGTLEGGVWNYEFDYTRDWSLSFSGAQSPLGLPTNVTGLQNVQLLNISDDSVALNGDFRTLGQTRQFLSIGGHYISSVDNSYEMTQKLEIKCVSGVLSIWNNDVLVGNTNPLVTLTENVRLKLSLDDYNMYNIKFLYI